MKNVFFKHILRFRPGYWIIVLTLWWLLPFFISDIFRYSIEAYLSSYYPYFIVFGTTLFFSFLANLLDTFFKFYREAGYWRKYFLVCGIYAVHMIAALIISILLEPVLHIDYFGGCPAGSFGMLFIPSIGANFILGALLCLVLTVYSTLKEIREQL
jgi:hypothetical protein